ncbi:MAG: protein adenylyltransferase SelO, partial [Opitutales bacterium]
RLSPVPVSKPKVVIFNQKLAEEMGLDLTHFNGQQKAGLLAGNLIPEGCTPFAQAYAGHQFGNFTMLGDGRAIILGEHLSSSGKRFDIQYKGSGRTPYSRGGDGRAALGPMLREYIISEAMHSLGIPTTRSLAVVSTGETVYREDELPGAILNRIASSHIRVGTFQFAALHQEKTISQSLLDYTIDRHFPESKDHGNKALALLDQVMKLQADLITHWMRVGFIHGVMNTDNMALCGETIDYGPCAFMDSFDPSTVFSSIDHQRRYAYANQPVMAHWNLARLAESLLPLIHENRETAIELAEDSLKAFEELYKSKWLAMMGNKLGLTKIEDQDEELITELLDLMHEYSADYTNTFLDLGQKELPAEEFYISEDFSNWHNRWVKRLQQEGGDSFALMRSVNPAVIPRNHKVEEALQAAERDDLTPFHHLLEAVTNPYESGEYLKPYQTPPNPKEKVLQTFCGT